MGGRRYLAEDDAWCAFCLYDMLAAMQPARLGFQPHHWTPTPDTSHRPRRNILDRPRHATPRHATPHSRPFLSLSPARTAARHEPRPSSLQVALLDWWPKHAQATPRPELHVRQSYNRQHLPSSLDFLFLLFAFCVCSYATKYSL